MWYAAPPAASELLQDLATQSRFVLRLPRHFLGSVPRFFNGRVAQVVSRAVGTSMVGLADGLDCFWESVCGIGWCLVGWSRGLLRRILSFHVDERVPYILFAVEIYIRRAETQTH